MWKVLGFIKPIQSTSHLNFIRSCNTTTQKTEKKRTFFYPQISKAQVKWWNMAKGYGFLTDLTTKEDIFAHVSQLKNQEDSFKQLVPGDTVIYERTKSPRPAAKNIKKNTKK